MWKNHQFLSSSKKMRTKESCFFFSASRCIYTVRRKTILFRCNSTKLLHDRFSKFVHSAATNCKRALKIPPHRQRVATTCIIPCEILVFENRPISKLVLKKELVKNRLLKSKTTAKQRFFSDASNISCTDEKMCMVVWPNKSKWSTKLTHLRCPRKNGRIKWVSC